MKVFTWEKTSWWLLIGEEIRDSLNLFSGSEFLVNLGPCYDWPLLFKSLFWTDHFHMILTFSQSIKIISRRRTDETGLNCGPSKMHHNKLNQIIWIIFDPWMAPSRFETSTFGRSILIVIPSWRALLWFLVFSYFSRQLNFFLFLARKF